MARRLSAVADRVDGRLIGADAEFAAVSTDTRSLPAGALFVAIQGENFDGNDYVDAAAERGAAGALVSRPQASDLPQIQVTDTRKAFGAMAHAWRSNFSIPVVAVTGSAGKTTVRELTAAILGQSRKLCVTQGNLNNDIGVPLSLMRIDADDEAMVVELGANHAGEILNLGQLVEPTVAIITNAGDAHLEGFGSVEGIARAKGELIDCLADDGIAVLNADDRFFDDWCERAGQRRIVSFGLSSSDADVRLLGDVQVVDGVSRFMMRLADGSEAQVQLALLGQANIANALAATAAAMAAGATADEVIAGLAGVEPVHGRMQQRAGRNGSTLIDDSYNANPSAARAALDFLAGCSGVRVFVLGDMLELGAESPALHAEVGTYARGRCDRLVAVGELAAEAAAAFGGDGAVCPDIKQAEAVVAPLLAPDVTVLIKASRSMGLDRLVAALAAAAGGTPC